jgi:hypothetical protein
MKRSANEANTFKFRYSQGHRNNATGRRITLRLPQEDIIIIISDIFSMGLRGFTASRSSANIRVDEVFQ